MKSRIANKGFLFGILIMFVGAGVIPSTVGTIIERTVLNGSNLSGYIQDLIDNADEGDTIYVPSGTYFENILINKSINLIGENKDTTIIMPYTNNRDIVSITSNWVNFSGFTIRKSGQNYYGIEIISNHNSVKGNVISENYGIGIAIFGSSNTIMDNEIISNSYDGIKLQNSRYNSINDNTISNNQYGITLNDDSDTNTITGNTIISNDIYGIEIYSANNNIIDNTISDNEYGINLDQNSDSNTITGNYISNNYCGINLDGSNNDITGNSFLNDGLYVSASNNNIIKDNTVNDKPLMYLKDETNKIIEVDAGQIIMIDCDDITVQNKEITNTYIGIILINTDNSLISKNNINTNKENGIDLYLSNNNIISENTINSNNVSGINIRRSSYNSISSNYLSDNDNGINLLNSPDDNTIDGNTINSNNFYGIIISNSDNNIITGNTIDSNGGDGIWLKTSDFNTIDSNNILKNTIGFRNLDLGSYGNIIYHNNFVDNVENAYDNSDMGNTWDDGKYGNYWSDYKQKYPNAKKKLQEGIWDTPYEIPGRYNVDNCPLIKQWPDPRGRTTPGFKITVHPIFDWFLERFPNALLMLRHIIELF